MSLPKSSEFYVPVLEFFKDNKIHTKDEVSKYLIEYFELTFSDSKVEVFDVRELKIVKTANVVIVKEILKGYAVYSDNSKREIYFYPQANTFRFADENQNYRIKCKGMLVYPLT